MRWMILLLLLVEPKSLIWQRRAKWFFFNRKIIYFVSNFNHLMTIIQCLILKSRALRAIHKTTDFENFFFHRQNEFKYSSSFYSFSDVLFAQKEQLPRKEQKNFDLILTSTFFFHVIDSIHFFRDGNSVFLELPLAKKATARYNAQTFARPISIGRNLRKIQNFSFSIHLPCSYNFQNL